MEPISGQRVKQRGAQRAPAQAAGEPEADTLVDERGWLAANAIVSALAAFTAFTSAGDDSAVDSE